MMISSIHYHLFQTSHYYLFILFFLFTFIHHDQVVHADNIQLLIVVHRHGARPPLTKHPFDPSIENSGLTPEQYPLYSQGQTQLELLGQYIREHYITTNSTSKIDALYNDNEEGKEGELIGYKVNAYSSNIPRTLVSSRMFLSGLFGNMEEEEAKVPTMAMNGSMTDWILRSYTLCPQLETNFRTFSQSEEYQRKKDDYSEFVERLGKSLKSDSFESTFENVFNIYDRYIIIHDGYDQTPDGHEVSSISDDDMKTLTNIANWFESSKYFYGSRNTGVTLGLLERIMNHMEEASKETYEGPRIIEYSAHYPTLLTLLYEILEIDSNPTILSPGDRIPGFGAALFLELHKQSDNQFIVILRWYPGDNLTNNTQSINDTMTLIHFQKGECSLYRNQSGCPLNYVKSSYMTDFNLQQFCTTCRNKQEGFCIRTTTWTPTSRLLFVVLGMFIGIIGSVFMMWLISRRKRKSFMITSSEHTEDGFVGD